MTLTEQSKTLLTDALRYAYDFENTGPWVCEVIEDKDMSRLRGNLSDLVQKGLICIVDDQGEGNQADMMISFCEEAFTFINYHFGCDEDMLIMSAWVREECSDYLGAI